MSIYVYIYVCVCECDIIILYHINDVKDKILYKAIYNLHQGVWDF